MTAAKLACGLFGVFVAIALGELRGAVRETVQPAHVSLWLRGGRR